MSVLKNQAKYMYPFLFMSFFFCEIAFASFNIRITFQTDSHSKYLLAYNSGDFAARSFVEDEYLQIANILQDSNYPPKMLLKGRNDDRFYVFRENSPDERIRYNIAYVGEDFDIDPPQNSTEEETSTLNLAYCCTDLFGNFRFFLF